MNASARSNGGLAAAAFAVIVLAAFFRLYQLGSVPPGLFGDEAANGLVAASIQEGEQFPVYVEEPEETKWGSREPLYHYFMAAVFAVAGADTTSIRSTSALIGIATVTVFFLVCSRLFGSRVALLAAILMAVGKWHVIASRIGLRAILVPLWIVLVVWAVERATRSRTVPSAVVCGLIGGLGFYTYPSYWVVPLCLLPVWAVSRYGGAATARDRGERSGGALFVAGTVAALIIVLPLLRYAVAKPDYYFARVTRAGSIVGEDQSRHESLRDNAQRVLFMLHLRGDENPRHNLPGEPLLDPLTGILFLVGLYQVAKGVGPDRVRSLGLLVFWLLPLLPSALGDSAPHALRALGATPAVYVIAAFGWQRLGRIGWIGPIVALAVGVGIVAVSYRDYFQRWAAEPSVAAGFNSDAVRFFDYIAQAAKTHDVFTSPYVYTSPQLRFRGRASAETWEPIVDERAFIAGEDTKRDRLLISDVATTNALIERLYPDKTQVVGRYAVPDGGPGRIYLVQSGDLRTSLNETEIELIEIVLALPKERELESPSEDFSTAQPTSSPLRASRH